MECAAFFVWIILNFRTIFGHNERYNIKSWEKYAMIREKVAPLQRTYSGILHPMNRKHGTKRIIGGHEAIPHAYPYQVALHPRLPDTVSFCGGTLFTTEYILTAAHCLTNVSSVRVFLGIHNINVDTMDPSVIKFDTRTFIIHELYDIKTIVYDIALIRLPQHVTLNKNIALVKIDGPENQHDGDAGRCIGWGDTDSHGTIPDLLKYTDMGIISNRECSGHYPEYIQGVHLCAIGYDSSGSCYGDSGGPLMVGNVQVGIVSFGEANCRTDRPIVFTRISRLHTWLMEKTNKVETRSTGLKVPIAPIMSIGMIFCFIF